MAELVVDAIVDGRPSTARTIAASLDHPLLEVELALAALERAGWLDRWQRPEELLFTLTPWAARRLGVALIETTRPAGWRWVRTGTRAESRAATARVAGHVPVDDVIDRPSRGADTSFRRLLGTDSVAWPGPTARSDGPCPICGDRPLPSGCYCLYCDRSSDAVGPASQRASRRPPAAASGPTLDRARRRARRLARFKPKRSAGGPDQG